MRINVLDYLPHNEFLIDIDAKERKLLFGTAQSTTLTALAKSLDVRLKNLSRYRNGTRSTPIDLFVKLLHISKLDLNTFQDKIRLKAYKSENSIAVGPFINIDEEWVYISELIRGDGHLPRSLWAIQFINKEHTLIKSVKTFFKRLGLRDRSLYLQTISDCFCLTVYSKLLVVLFSSLFKIPVGAKGEMHLPLFIMKDKSLAAAAIRGAFDAEGTVAVKYSKRISICSISRLWMRDLQYILDMLRIKSRFYLENRKNNPIYRLHITHQINIKRFYDIINPLHPKRRRKIEQIITYFKGKPIVHGLYKPILRALENGISKRRDLSGYLEICKRKVGNNLMALKARELIEPIDKVYSNLGSYYKFGLTDKGRRYLNEPSHSFFD